jgi:hypothetical protein
MSEDRATRVQRGVALLDGKDSGWWREREHWRTIDLDVLDMGDPSRCVAGQLCGDFSRAVGRWGVSLDDAERHGFTLTNAELDAMWDGRDRHAWVDLGDEWRRVIAERRAQAVDRAGV